MDSVDGGNFHTETVALGSDRFHLGEIGKFVPLILITVIMEWWGGRAYIHLRKNLHIFTLQNFLLLFKILFSYDNHDMPQMYPSGWLYFWFL